MRKIIKSTGETIEVSPKSQKGFTLKELQELVQGSIEVIPLGTKSLMVINEDGKILELPYNEKATQIYRTYYTTNDFIVGDVLICNSKDVN